MHLVERYSLGTGAKIGKPFILEKFFPMDITNYITLQPRGKYDSRSYDYWQETVDVLLPILKKSNNLNFNSFFPTGVVKSKLLSE